MKTKTVIIGCAFIGTFLLGAMFAPIGKSTATVNNQAASSEKVSITQTADENDISFGSFGTCPMSGAQMGSSYGMRGYDSESMHNIIAESLGLTSAELRDARYAGKSIAELAEEKGVSIDELVAKLIDSRKAYMEQQVNEGLITKEQMDTMIANMEVGMKTAIENENFGLMHGHGGGMGMGHHRGYFNNSTIN